MIASALASAKSAAVELDVLRLAVTHATTVDEVEHYLDKSERLAAQIDAETANASGTDAEMAELRHWASRCGQHVQKARAAGVQSYQLLRRGRR